MITPARVRLAIAACLAAAACAPAATAAAWEDPRFEITPYYGYRFGGEFDELEDAAVDALEADDSDALGIILGYNWDENVLFELSYSVQATTLQASGAIFTPAGADLFDLDIETWQIGGAYTWGRAMEPVRGFLGFSAGVNTFDPDTPAFDGDSRFAFSFYGGARVRVARHFGLRFQVAWVSTWLDTESDFFCNEFNCFEVADAEFFSQVELAGGLTLKF